MTTKDEWASFGLRHLPHMSARDRVSEVPEIQDLIDDLLSGYRAELAKPLQGVTSDGSILPTPSPPAGGVDITTLRVAALAFLGSLDPDLRSRVNLPLDDTVRRSWINVHMNFFRQGIMLEDLSDHQRHLAFELIRTTLSTHGYEQARDIMRINELVALLTDDHDQYGELLYYLTVFGTPSASEPWAWQLDGHHLNINCLVVGDRMVMTPTFMGSEPCRVVSGPYAGIEVLAQEERVGLDLIGSLATDQRAAAVLYPSILPGTIPAHLQHWIDGRMQAGPFQDNIVMAYQGLPGRLLEPHQRELLLATVGVFADWARDDHARVRRDEVERHLDDTWFSWMGGHVGSEPFYYRVHSPVVLVEFDHHPGIVFANEEPTRHHIHTIIRTPNGGDYGADLLARHYEMHPHP